MEFLKLIEPWVFSSLLTNLKEPTGVIIVVCLIFYKVSFQQAPLEDVIVLSFFFTELRKEFLDIQNNWQRIHGNVVLVYFLLKKPLKN